MTTTDALRIVRSRGTVLTGYTTLGDAADALADEVERLQKAITRMGNESDELSLLVELRQHPQVRTSLRTLGTFAFKTLDASEAEATP